jgi:AraC family transcriptional regulator
MRMTAVPLRESDLVRRAVSSGFALTEAWSPPGGIPSHAHHALSLTILLDGAFEETYLPIHRPQECAAGSVLVRPPEEPHANRIGKQGGRTLSIEIEAGRLDCHGQALDALASLAHRREVAFLDLGLAMSNELRCADAASGLALESLSLELLARLLRAREPSATAASWLRPAIDTLHDRFRDHTLRITDLASQAGVHPVYFARAFREVCGVTPGEYVRRLRLEWTRERIVTSSATLAELALEAGFADQSHLTRAFHARYGATPAQLRRSIDPRR